MASYKTILKKLGEAQLKGSQSRMLLKILSKMTESEDQSVKFTKRSLAEMLGIKESNVNIDLNYLIEKEYLIVDDKTINNRTYRLGKFFNNK